MIAMADDVNKSYLLCLAFIPVAPTGVSIYNPGPCFVPLLLSSPILPLFSNLSLYHHSALTVALVFHLFLMTEAKKLQRAASDEQIDR